MKENLLRTKRLLERKCFASDDGSEYKVESYLEVVKSIDNEGAFNHIQDYINGAREYYTRNGIEYDEIQLYPRFSYADRYPYAIENKVQPIQDILRVYVNAVGYENNGTKSTIDSDDTSTYQEFIITFDEFKAMLKASGLTVGYSTFEDILEDYRSYKPTVCKISKGKNKIKTLTKEQYGRIDSMT